MFRQKENQRKKEQRQRMKKKLQQQQHRKEKEKMSSPFAIPQELDKEVEVEVEEEKKDNDDNSVSNNNLDNDDHVTHDIDEDEDANKKSSDLMLQTWKSLLLEKRQENEKLTILCNELYERRDHLIDSKLQKLVSIITTLTPDSDDPEHSYLHLLNIKNKNCIKFIREQMQSDKLKANAYMEQYNEYQEKLREDILQKESFDEYTMMSYKDVDDAKEALANSTKNLQEEIEGNKLKGQEITKMAEETYKNILDEISKLESYENELINAKKQLKFEADKPNLFKKLY